MAYQQDHQAGPERLSQLYSYHVPNLEVFYCRCPYAERPSLPKPRAIPNSSTLLLPTTSLQRSLMVALIISSASRCGRITPSATSSVFLKPRRPLAGRLPQDKFAGQYPSQMEAMSHPQSVALLN